MKNELIVGLDIGTTKICAVVGEVTEKTINIVGLGSHPSVGLRKGVVVNIEDTVESIRKAVEEAELMAGCEVTEVYAGIAGGHIKGFNSIGVIAIKNKEVTQSDVDRVIDTARAVAIPMDREVIHIIPQEFIVDDEGGIRDPIGISGVRLEARVHMVTAAATSAHNIIKCANRAGLDVCDIVLEPIASSEAVLTPEERDLGVALVDFGGGTTDLAIFSGNSVRHTSVLALGGNNLTHDIAVGLRTPEIEAEIIKKRYGCALTSMISKDDVIEVPSAGSGRTRKISRRILGDILEPRVEEVFTLIQREMIRSGYEDLPVSGIVLTGGSSLLPGIPEVAEQVFNLPVRRGYPHSIGGLVDIVNSPMYATGVGLVLYGKRAKPGKKFRIRDKNIFNRVLGRMKKWIQDII
ncbi:MAG: cell division protein FtsA [Deltaproteobacteria bacterium]|nr:cell division protein FtsA [Deltaproteobacteria bacterium]